MPPKITPQVVDAASDEIRAYYRELSERLVKRGMKPLPDIRMYVSRKIRKNYGYAAFRVKDGQMSVLKIAIAWSAYRKGKSMWHDVVAHEAAHAYTMAYHNRADHSPAWRHIAQLLGCTGDMVGCEDAGRRDQAKQRAESLPTVITKLSARDMAALRRSLEFQKRKHKDLRAAIDATILRFPQYDERQAREYLFKLNGLTTKAVQLSFGF